MLVLLKFLQSLVKALHTEGTPGQVALGMTLGAALGLTPLMSLHNLLIVAAIFLLNVSVPGAVLGLTIFTPLGFILDPVFDRIGLVILEATPFQGLWTTLYNEPVVPFSNFNNSVLLGSVIGYVALAVPIFFAARFGVARYRATLGARVQRSKWYKAITASKVYNVYRLFRPE